MRIDRLKRKRTRFIAARRGASGVVVAVIVAKPDNATPSPLGFLWNLSHSGGDVLPIAARPVLSFFDDQGDQAGGSMKNLFQREAVEEVISRIDKLRPATQRQWGKMDVAQMLA